MWLEQLVEAAHGQLGDPEREVLWGRGVSDEQIRLFRLGVLNQVLPTGPQYPPKFLEWCWSGRRLDHMFVLPMTNTLGQVKGIQVRHVDRSKKGYSNFYAAEDEPVFFGLAQAMPSVWSRRSAWLVEGPFDLFPVQRVVPNVISTMTAGLPQPLYRSLKRLVDELWLGYDRDEAGQRGIRVIQNTHGREFRVHSVQWPGVQRLDGQGPVKDPSDLWEAWGDERLGVFLRALDN